MKDLIALILAAGKGTRLKASGPKVLVQTDEGPLLSLVLSTLRAIPLSSLSLVVGALKEELIDYTHNYMKAAGSELPKITFYEQEKIDGTASAVKAALPAFKDSSGNVLIVSGDMPLITADTLKALIEHHEREKSELTVLCGIVADPAQYGRIIREHSDQSVRAIREWKDCSPAERSIREVNAGVYLISASLLTECLGKISNRNQAGEFYLTDIVQIASSLKRKLSTFHFSDSREMLGVNTRAELHQVNAILQERRIDYWIEQGVTFVDTKNVYLDPEVRFLGRATVGPSTILRGKTVIGEDVHIEGFSFLSETEVLSGARILFASRVHDSTIGQHSQIGPFSNIREGTKLCEGTKVGSFVETKKTILNKGAKAPHLSYLGDSIVGEHANIGAGTITCNYDGQFKHQTQIGDRAFIGSNSSLVAPVRIGDGAYVGAGSVITKDVKEDSLSLTRSEQREIVDWAKRKKQK